MFVTVVCFLLQFWSDMAEEQEYLSTSDRIEVCKGLHVQRHPIWSNAMRKLVDWVSIVLGFIAHSLAFKLQEVTRLSGFSRVKGFIL